MLYTLTNIPAEPGGEITHEQESYTDLHWGKFGSQMAHFLYVNMLHGVLNADDSASNADIGEWAERYGRRVLCGDSQGFIDVDTYKTVGEAEEAMAHAHAALDEPDDDEEPEAEPVNPYAGPGGLLDEIKQAERILGTE